MKTLTIIGGGNVGRTLGFLWRDAKTFAVRQVLNRSVESAREAAKFIGEGNAVPSFDALSPTDVYLISTPDAHIGACCDRLAATAGLLTAASTVLHCSGSLSASVLSAALGQGARAASVHPVKSFADPALAVQTFTGTFCGVEGVIGGENFIASENLISGEDDVVADAFRRIGGVLFGIDPAQKTVYHAGTVFASNYLVALMETALRCFERAGIAREEASRLMEPITHGTLDNVLALGTTRALTGPIARGDQAVVARQHAALSAWDGDMSLAYVALGRVALQLSSKQGNAGAQDLQVIQDVLTQAAHQAGDRS